jgi:hypothetical protein
VTPAGFVLLVLACGPHPQTGQRECVAVIDEVSTVAECRARYQEIKATLPANVTLGFPECSRRRSQ